MTLAGVTVSCAGVTGGRPSPRPGGPAEDSRVIFFKFHKPECARDCSASQTAAPRAFVESWGALVQMFNVTPFSRPSAISLYGLLAWMARQFLRSDVRTVARCRQ